MSYFVAYIATAIVFLAIDAVWLGRVATSFYKSELGDLMAPKVNFAAAGGFYLVYCMGIVIFAVAPALEADAWTGRSPLRCAIRLLLLRDLRHDKSCNSA